MLENMNDNDDNDRLARLTAGSKSVSEYKEEPDPKYSPEFDVWPDEQFVDDIDINKYKDIGPVVFTHPAIIAKIKPFQIKYTYGLNPDAGILNMTSKEKTEIIYAAAHIVVIYDYCKNEYRYLEGHQNAVCTLSKDGIGSYLVTGDYGPDACVIVWDKEGKPIFTIFDIYPEAGCITVKLSYNGKYLITVGYDPSEECYLVDMWLWTYGEAEPHDRIKIKTIYGKPKKVCFNITKDEHIMIVFEKQVFFCVWDEENKKFTPLEAPKIQNRSKLGLLTSGTYCELRHRSYVCTDKGYVLVFANTLYIRAFWEAELNNSKIYLKAVKISKAPLVTCRSVDGIMMFGATDGRIYFLDVYLEVIYLYEKKEFNGLRQVAFNTIPQLHIDNKVDKPRGFKPQCEAEFKLSQPTSDFSLNRKPLYIREFVVLTENCEMYVIDKFNEIVETVFPSIDACVTSMEPHAELPYLLVGHANGTLTLVNYEKSKIITKVKLPICNEYDPYIEDPAAISCIKYSNESIHLVCSNNTGELFVLDTVLLTSLTPSKKPLKISTTKIIQIAFNFESSQFAYYDQNMIVAFFKFNSIKLEWIFMGKLGPHYKPVNDILFIPEPTNSTLVTIGDDRYIIKYNNVNIDDDEQLKIILRERIEQTAIPKCFVYYSKNVGNSFVGYYTVTDNQYKFKLINDTTMMTRQVALGPAYGPFKGHHIRKLLFPEKLEFKYYLFMVDKQIGIQKATLDGNPYSYVAYLAHPKQVMDMAISYDGKYVFTRGEGDKTVFISEIITKAVDLVHLLGGKEFQPYYCLLEGGRNGWMFQEIQDLFYYMQILHQGENVVLPRKFSDMIAISELPDLVRACGYYPSEFEIENLMIEARYKTYDETRKAQEQISFFEFLKLFVNHRPAHGYFLENLREAFDTFADIGENEGTGEISKSDYINVLTTFGERMHIENLKKCFSTLRKIGSTYGDTVVFPEEMDFDMLVETILGIEMYREKVDNEEDTYSLTTAPDKTEDEQEQDASDEISISVIDY